VSETDKDIGNTEAWAKVIGDLLRLVPSDRRAAVLALAAATEESERREAEANGGWLSLDLSKGWTDSPGICHWHAIMRLKSLVRLLRDYLPPDPEAEIAPPAKPKNLHKRKVSVRTVCAQTNETA
jgi:hypothetical protein